MSFLPLQRRICTRGHYNSNHFGVSPLADELQKQPVMRLHDIMTTKVETVTLGTSAEDAWNRMKGRRIHHLVVMDGASVAGVLSDRDLGSARGAALRADKSVDDLMACPVVSVTSNTTVREAANKLRGRSIGCLPVVDRGRLTGIVTVSDLLELIGRGVERPIAKSTRWTLARRGPRGPFSRT